VAEQPPEEQKLQVRDVEKLKEVLAAEPPPPPSEEVVHLPADPPPPPSDEAATQVVQTGVQPPPNATPSTTDGDEHPRLADGVELLGEYEGSGFKEPRYNARRAGGEMVQLTELLYLIAEAIDGRRSFEEIATQVSGKYGKKVSADNVKTLIDNNLGPDGFVSGYESKQDGSNVDPLLALKFRLTLFPERAVAFVAALLRPLFWPPMILAALVGFVILDVWYFGHHGVAQSLRDLIYQPLIVLMVYAVLIVSVLWHELGHATACRYGGAKPGRIGFGIYLVWPAFFTDVTDALKLGKGGRVRTDLGGIYFNVLFSLAVGGIYMLTGFEPILVLIVMQHLMILYNLMPFLRLDGYHAISDLTGIPDLFARIKPTVEGLVPFKETPDEVTELKPWARTVVTVWVLMVIPVLLYVFSMMVLSVPRVVATGLDSLNQQWDKVGAALDKGAIATVAVGAIQSLMIVLPAMGMGFSFFRIGRRIGSGFIEMTSERPILRTAFGIVGLSALAAAAFVLIPNGEYKPIQSDETWTVSESVDAVSSFTTGRPSLTEEREETLGGAPFLNESDEEFVPSYDREDTQGESSGDPSTTEEDQQEAPADPQASEPAPTPTPTS
jgi:putative peptide zinc metalloprotease protein